MTGTKFPWSVTRQANERPTASSNNHSILDGKCRQRRLAWIRSPPYEPKAVLFLGQMRRIETKKQGWRFHFTLLPPFGRRNIKRLLAA